MSIKSELRDWQSLNWKKVVEGLRSPVGQGWAIFFRRGYQRDAWYRDARATQTGRGSRPVLTLHWNQSPIHLIDSLMASSARGCDIADIGVCPPRSQTLLELCNDSQHIWRRSNLILVHILGGHIAGRTTGALLFKLILSMRPCDTNIWGQGCKISQCTVAWVACWPYEYTGGLWVRGYL